MRFSRAVAIRNLIDLKKNEDITVELKIFSFCDKIDECRKRIDHLDRQPLNNIARQVLNHTRRAVSYTHLDVYKRQV